MSKIPPGPLTMRWLQPRLMTVIGLLVFAFILWQGQNFIASFAAGQWTTETRLRTMQPKGDARVVKAFEAARQQQRSRIQAVLNSDADPGNDTRDFTLSITAGTYNEALEARENLVLGMRLEFSREGPGELYDIGNAPYAVPASNLWVPLIQQVCRGLSVTMLLAGLGILLVMWRHSRLPKRYLLLVLVPAFPISVLILGKTAITLGVWALVLALPLGGLALTGWMTRLVKKAASWQTAHGRITRSQVRVERYRLYEAATKVFNKADVAYQFPVGTKRVQGHRISLGITFADTVGQVLKRYPLGAEVEVFYNPADPQECVLERQPPASLSGLWAAVFTGILLYAVLVFCFVHGETVSGVFGAAFPQVRHPLVMLVTGLLGLLSLLGGIWQRIRPRSTMPWSRTQGVIVSSVVEAFEKSHSNRRHVKTTYHQAVIEFSYKVDGHSYHNTSSGKTFWGFTVAGERIAAQNETARYPEGKEVDVFYDPQDPTQSSLEAGKTSPSGSTVSLVAGIILLAVAVYAAM